MRTFDPEKAAMALIDAQMMGDKKAADKWDVTPRTLTNWRKRLSEDSIFSVYFQKK
jgi:transposase-like protein